MNDDCAELLQKEEEQEQAVRAKAIANYKPEPGSSPSSLPSSFSRCVPNTAAVCVCVCVCVCICVYLCVCVCVYVFVCVCVLFDYSIHMHFFVLLLLPS
jgi:hypothetical protein